MGSRRSYEADQQVIEACLERGMKVTPRQLERWRRFLPRREVEYVVGVRGSRTSNPPGYVDQVIAIAEAVAARIPLHRIPMILFARGMPVELDDLRGAYLDLLERVAHDVDTMCASVAAHEDDLADRPDAVAMHMVSHSRGSANLVTADARPGHVRLCGRGKSSPAVSIRRSLLLGVPLSLAHSPGTWPRRMGWQRYWQCSA